MGDPPRGREKQNGAQRMPVFIVTYEGIDDTLTVLIEKTNMTIAIIEIASRGSNPEMGFPQPFDPARVTSCTMIKNYDGFIGRDGTLIHSPHSPRR